MSENECKHRWIPFSRPNGGDCANCNASLSSGYVNNLEQKVRELVKENEELKERLESTCEQRLVYEQDAEKYHDEAVKYKKVIKLLTEHYNCRHIWG